MSAETIRETVEVEEGDPGASHATKTERRVVVVAAVATVVLFGTILLTVYLTMHDYVIDLSSWPQ